jgi:hypothetical protein
MPVESFKMICQISWLFTTPLSKFLQSCGSGLIVTNLDPLMVFRSVSYHGTLLKDLVLHSVENINNEFGTYYNKTEREFHDMFV